MAIWAVLLALGTQPSPARVEILASPGVKVPDAEHVARIVQNAAAELGVEESASPRMLLIYATPQAAGVGQIAADGSVTTQTIVREPEPVYEIWITGKPSDANAALGIAAALNMRFGLGMGRPELLLATDRICRRLKQTVTVNALRLRPK